MLDEQKQNGTGFYELKMDVPAHLNRCLRRPQKMSTQRGGAEASLIRWNAGSMERDDGNEARLYLGLIAATLQMAVSSPWWWQCCRLICLCVGCCLENQKTELLLNLFHLWHLWRWPLAAETNVLQRSLPLKTFDVRVWEITGDNFLPIQMWCHERYDLLQVAMWWWGSIWVFQQRRPFVLLELL